MNVDESSLSRVWAMASDPKRIFAIVTAFRGEHSPRRNQQRNLDLIADVRSLGYGFFILDGVWIENPGTDQEVRASEDSLFVSVPMEDTDANRFRDDILHLIRKYDQEAAILKVSPDEGVSLLFPNGGTKPVGGAFRPGMEGDPRFLAQAYSKLRGDGRTFVFESARSPGFMSALVQKLLNESGPDHEDGCDHEGFAGGCVRFGHTTGTCPHRPR